MTKKMIAMLLMTFLWGFCLAGNAAPLAGIVLTDRNSVNIYRADGQQIPCKLHETLFEGDRIIGPGAEYVAVKWYLNAKGIVVGPDEVRAEIYRPSTIEQLSNKIQEFLGILDTERKTAAMVTRAGENDSLLLPGQGATLLPGQKVDYVWGAKTGKAFIVADSNGNEIFRQHVSGQEVVSFSPEEVGLSPGGKYRWAIEGVKGLNRISVLDARTAELIQTGLASYSKEKNEAEKGIKQAAYLQLMSDSYPESIDLYWLSGQILKNISLRNDSRIEYLEKRMVKHFDE